MQVYAYNDLTSEYIGVAKAYPSPLEPDKWLIPSNATTAIPPDCTEGYVVKFVGGEWALEKIITQEEPQPPIKSLSDMKLAKQTEITNNADSFLGSMAQEYGAYEKLTWDQQALEADALLGDAESPAPLVRAIAQARGMSALEMAQRIAANRAQWVALSGSAVGKRLAYQDSLDAAQTVEEVNAIKPVFP